MSELSVMVFEQFGIRDNCEVRIMDFLESENFKKITKQDWSKYKWIEFDEWKYDDGDAVLPLRIEERKLNKEQTIENIQDEICLIGLVEEEIDELEYRINELSQRVDGHLDECLFDLCENREIYHYE